MSSKIYWSILPTPKQSDTPGAQKGTENSALELQEATTIFAREERESGRNTLPTVLDIN